MSAILKEVTSMRWTALALGLGTLLLVAVVVVGVLQRMVLKPLGGEPAQAVVLAQQVAQGDFSHAVALDPKDTGSVMSQLVKMQQSLSQLVTQVRTKAHGVALASQEISQGNADLSQRTEEQAAALEQTSASMEELNITVQQNAERTQHASALAKEATQVAGRSGHAMQAMLDNLIENSVQQVDHGAQQAEHVSQTIHQVVQVITKVTGLLAEVSSASAEQSQGVASVGEAVMHMDTNTQKNAALVEEMAAAAMSLHSQSQDLVQLVSVFKLKAGH